MSTAADPTASKATERRDRLRLAALLHAIAHARVTPELRMLLDVPGQSGAAIATASLLSDDPAAVAQRGSVLGLADRYLSADAGTVEAAAWAAALASRSEAVLEAARLMSTPVDDGPTRTVRLGRAILALPAATRIGTIAAVSCEVEQFGRLLRNSGDPGHLALLVLNIIRGMLVAARDRGELARWTERAGYLVTDGVPERVARVVASALIGPSVERQVRVFDCARDYLRAYREPEMRPLRTMAVVGLLVDDAELRAMAAQAQWQAPENQQQWAGQFGQRVVALAQAGDRAALDLVLEDHPEWGRRLLNALDIASGLPGAAPNQSAAQAGT